MSHNTHLPPADIALTSVLCALWTILNFTLGPLSFRLFGLPIFHDFAAFFTLLLVIWVTGRSGTASLVGTVGSIIVLLVGGPLPNIGFAAAAILFDVAMSGSRHKLHVRAYDMIVATFATLVSAYFAGVIIGVFLMNNPLNLETLHTALTIWGGWHLVGGILSVTVTLPIIGILEKANVRKIKGGA